MARAPHPPSLSGPTGAEAERPLAQRGAVPPADDQQPLIIRLIDTPSGESFEAEYLGKTDEGFGFSIEGAEVIVPRADLDAGVVRLEALDAMADGGAAAQLGTPAQDAAPQPEDGTDGPLRTHVRGTGRGRTTAPAEADLASGIAGDHDPADPAAGDGGVEPEPRQLAGGDPAGDASGPIGDADAGNLDVPVEAAAQPPSVEPIRRNAAVLRGWPKDAPPAVPGVSLKWDGQAGGFIFPRKHTDAVQAAVVGTPLASEASVPHATPEPQAAAAEQASPARPERDGAGDAGPVATRDKPAAIAARPVRTDKAITARGREIPVGYAVVEPADLTSGGAPDSRKDGRQNAAPSPAAQAFEAAASKAEKAPTDAQKAAGNYRKGKTRWQGLGLSIENAKGSERSGVGRDGEPWSVAMPAHYGYILGTKGADKDQVDFYMGDKPESDFVLVVDQKDADTGAWDEHKVVLGAANAKEALDLYKAGFSDGRGSDRIGGVRKMDTAEFKEWIRTGNTRKPASAKFRGQMKRARA